MKINENQGKIIENQWKSMKIGTKSTFFVLIAYRMLILVKIICFCTDFDWILEDFKGFWLDFGWFWMKNQWKSLKINEKARKIRKSWKIGTISTFFALPAFQMLILMKIICFYNDFELFGRDFGGFCMVLDGFGTVNQWKSMKVNGYAMKTQHLSTNIKKSAVATVSWATLLLSRALKRQ